MGIIKAIAAATSSTLADQWLDIITAGSFDEHTAVVPGLLKSTNNGKGENYKGSDGVISNGSKIFVPENTAAFIFNASEIENIITQPGAYEYQDGEDSIFDQGELGPTLFGQMKDRVKHGGVTSTQKRIAFVNLREIRDIKFGTRGPQIYNDTFYGVDLEVYAYGSFTVKITDPEAFIRNFVPANVTYYTFDDPKVRSQLLSEFLQSFVVALNSLSASYRVSHIPAHANELSNSIAMDSFNAGTWEKRFGFKICKVAIENIELSDDSKELVKQYASNKMNVKAYEDVSQKSADIAAQQKVAQGIQEHGFGDAGGMIMGMNVAQGFGAAVEPKKTMSIDEQIETVKKLKELLDAGILTNEEFEQKKKEIMGL